MNDVVIGTGQLVGKGVYASRDFQKDEIVIQYTLRSLTEAEFDELPDSEKIFTHRHHGIMQLYSEPERYVNHSTTPNTYQDLLNQRDVALRKIKKGEAITTDASMDDAA